MDRRRQHARRRAVRVAARVLLADARTVEFIASVYLLAFGVFFYLGDWAGWVAHNLPALRSVDWAVSLAIIIAALGWMRAALVNDTAARARYALGGVVFWAFVAIEFAINKGPFRPGCVMFSLSALVMVWVYVRARVDNVRP